MADKHTTFTSEEIDELERTGELTPYTPVPLRVILLLSLVIDPVIAQGLSVLSGKMNILTNYATSDKTRALLIILYPIIVVILIALADLLTSGERKQRREELTAIKAKREQRARTIKDHQSAITLISKCEEHGIKSAETEADRSAIWIVAQSIGIASKEEALSLYSEAKKPSRKTQAILKEETDRKRAEQVKADSDEAYRLNKLYPAALIGKDKYLTRIKKELQELEEKQEALLAAANYIGSGAAYIPTKPKNVTLKAAKGQLIGGPGLAAARAASAEKCHPGGMPSVSAVQSAAEWGVNKQREAIELEPRIKELQAQIADIEARLIDTDNQGKYAKFAQCRVKSLSLTDGGNIKAWILPVAGAAKDAMILDEPAIVDGSVTIKAWLNGERIGQAVYCPGGFDGNLSWAGFGARRWDPVIILVNRTLVPDDLGSIAITFEPKTIWAIQKNPAA